MVVPVQAEDLGVQEGAGRSDQLGPPGPGSDVDMDIAGLNLPANSGIADGLAGMAAAQPFSSADSLGAADAAPHPSPRLACLASACGALYKCSIALYDCSIVGNAVLDI